LTRSGTGVTRPGIARRARRRCRWRMAGMGSLLNTGPAPTGCSCASAGPAAGPVTSCWPTGSSATRQPNEVQRLKDRDLSFCSAFVCSFGCNSPRNCRQIPGPGARVRFEDIFRRHGGGVRGGEDIELRLTLRPCRNHRHERQSTQTTCLHDEPFGAVTGTQPNVIGTVCPGVLRQAGQPPMWDSPCRSTH
jgi:hypothetical protein